MIAKDSEHPRSRKIGPAPNVNVTPMIDVLLVLLIIFMVVAPTRPAKFETKIPGKATGATQPSQDLLMIVAGNGSGEDQTVSLNSRPMQLAELRVVLRDILEERADKTVYIKAPAWKRYSASWR